MHLSVSQPNVAERSGNLASTFQYSLCMHVYLHVTQASNLPSSNVFNDIEMGFPLFPYKMAITSEVLHQNTKYFK